MKTILFCFGTRPETIKMAPIIHEAQKSGFKTIVCITEQHKEMLLPFLSFFSIKSDYALNIMKDNQGLSSLTASILTEMDAVLSDCRPDYVCVQGDTTSTFSCSLASFYQKIPVIHIEAGLRTKNKYSPFPEEINRQMVSTYASYHFCPTELNKKNLTFEGRPNVYVSGNTSIDALRITLEKLKQDEDKFLKDPQFKELNLNKKIILVTAHRRENHGKPLEDICEALKEIALKEDCQIVYPVHLNPNVMSVVKKKLSHIKNIFLISALPYDKFIWLMSQANIIVTDSGGIQEEAPFLKKPILVLRESTERPEVVDVGAAKLVGSDKKSIIKNISKCLNDKAFYQSFQVSENPYGDGFASKKIINTIKTL